MGGVSGADSRAGARAPSLHLTKPATGRPAREEQAERASRGSRQPGHRSPGLSGARKPGPPPLQQAPRQPGQHKAGGLPRLAPDHPLAGDPAPACRTPERRAPPPPAECRATRPAPALAPPRPRDSGRSAGRPARVATQPSPAGFQRESTGSLEVCSYKSPSSSRSRTRSDSGAEADWHADLWYCRAGDSVATARLPSRQPAGGAPARAPYKSGR